jgi:hypothetical protein
LLSLISSCPHEVDDAVKERKILVVLDQEHAQRAFESFVHRLPLRMARRNTVTVLGGGSVCKSGPLKKGGC